jgi:hypothetical protein
MIQRVPLKSRTTRKRAEAGDGKPPKSTRFSAPNQTDHATSGVDGLDVTRRHGATAMGKKINEDRRAHEAEFVIKTEFVILPGENPLEFEMLHARLVEELSPDGPLQEDAVLTIAKCLWHKQRYQRFLAARVTTAQVDHRHEPYDKATILNTFSVLIGHFAEKDAGDFKEIRRQLEQLAGGRFVEIADHLEAKCPRREFRTEWDWVFALQKEVQIFAATRIGDRPDEGLIQQSSTVLTDDVFARELEFEEWIDKIIAQALTRLEKIKKSKQQTLFREAQRLGGARQGLVIGLVK